MNGRIVAQAEPLNADAVPSKDVVFEDVEHGLAELLDSLWADRETIPNKTGYNANVCCNLQNRVVDPINLK